MEHVLAAPNAWKRAVPEVEGRPFPLASLGAAMRRQNMPAKLAFLILMQISPPERPVATL